MRRGTNIGTDKPMAVGRGEESGPPYEKQLKEIMNRSILALVTLCSAILIAGLTRASTNETRHVDHTIIKEPAYQSTPKYCLMTLGKSGAVKVWMVEDGKRLFVDKNAN